MLLTFGSQLEKPAQDHPGISFSTTATIEMHGGAGMTSLNCQFIAHQASLNLEQMKSTMSCQISELEKFLKSAVLEAKDVICDIQITLHEQKKLLEFSVKNKKRKRLLKKRSEEQAMEKIAAILASLSAKKTSMLSQVSEASRNIEDFTTQGNKRLLQEISSMKQVSGDAKEELNVYLEKVSEASRNIEDSTTQGNKRLLQEISSMKQVSGDAKEELNVYLEKVKTHFLEDAFTSAEARATMGSCLQECSGKMHSYPSTNKSSIAEIASTVK
ncbi:ATP binding microtubule motor family protein [Actinidia rufa]|uniref:ATP binding microtubule motor family protein n=1 Tax=Actinidia rufa TaxID=165716 RepID=A0A7J0DI75_9ERIC|nr:ATP binding microtubule motor family protein [Actinidia rufa]